jgi:hypothetical protein
MYQIFLPIHIFFKYAILLLILVVVVKSLVGWLSKSQFSKGDNILSVLVMAFAHMQFFIGLVLYFVSPNVQFTEGFMKNPALRYWSIEHISLMLVAIILITIGRISSKKAKNDAAKHKKLFLFTALGFLLIVVSILQSGRGLF